jgi:hypothetical protein
MAAFHWQMIASKLGKTGLELIFKCNWLLEERIKERICAIKRLDVTQRGCSIVALLNLLCFILATPLKGKQIE